MAKAPKTGLDRIGRTLNVGDLVAYVGSSKLRLNIGRIISFSAKSARVDPIPDHRPIIANSYPGTRPMSVGWERIMLISPVNENEANLPNDWLVQIYNSPAE